MYPDWCIEAAKAVYKRDRLLEPVGDLSDVVIQEWAKLIYGAYNVHNRS